VFLDQSGYDGNSDAWEAARRLNMSLPFSGTIRSMKFVSLNYPRHPRSSNESYRNARHWNVSNEEKHFHYLAVLKDQWGYAHKTISEMFW